jgi:hypothetical protein
MMRKAISRLLLLGALASGASAQFELGEIRGTVRDLSGAVVPGARIVLTHSDTGIERTTRTDESGNYSFPGLRLGAYTLRAEKEGFRPAAAAVSALRVAERLRVDFELEPGAVVEEIVVSATVDSLLETEMAARSHWIRGEQIRELPLNKRDYTQLVLLAPGTVFDPAKRIGGAININGNRSLQNNFLLDGVDNNSNATSFRGERVDVIRPSVDAVAEFRVQTNSYSAEYGRSAGGVVNVTLKNGGNELRGALWEFFRNDRLDAKGWTPTNPPNTKPKLRFHQFGANAGGPIRRNRTFWFLNYEGERERSGATYIGTVPTPELQAGNFANVPITGDLAIRPVDPTSGQPFPNDLIPPSRWDPVARRIVTNPDFPKPTRIAALPIPGLYLNTVTNRLRTDKFDVRLDEHFNDRFRLFGRYSFSDLELFRPSMFPGYVEGSFNDGFGTTATRGQHAVLAPTITLNPTTLAEVRLGYTRLGANVYPPNFGSPGPSELLGIPNLPDHPRINGGWPKLIFDGMNALGRHTSTPQFQIPNVYVANNTWSLQRGGHGLKLGYEVQHIQTAILDVSALIGLFTSRRNTFTNNPWADFLLGLPASHGQTSYSVIYNRKTIQSAFLQDDWRVAPSLTLNLGLRYEYGRPILEKFNRLANFNPSTGQVSYARDGSLFERALVMPDRNDFGPRIGLAWTATRRLVVRSAYGVFYNHTNRQGREGLLGMNPPFVRDLVRVQDRNTPNPITLSGGPPRNFLETARPVDQILRGNDPLLRNPYIMQWHFTLQHEFAPQWLFEAGYVANRGLKLSRFLNANQALTTGPAATLQQRRPFPTWADIQYMDSGGVSTFHSLQTRLERRWASGLALSHAFTYGRVLTNSGNWGDGQLSPQNSYDARSEWGLDMISIKFNSVAHWIYQLPFGRGRRWMKGAPGAVEAVLGGWQVSGIWSWRSGFPVTISSSSCGTCNLGGQRSQRADVVAGQTWRVDEPTTFRWFNTGAFRSAAGPFGTAGRGLVYGPGLHNWDFTFAKEFAWGERRSAQFRAELFNAFNQVNFNPPGSNVSGAGFGVLTSALAGRSIQLGLKLYY